MQPRRSPRRILLSVPHMSGRELKYVQEAFDGNWLATVGPNITALESEFSLLSNSPAVALASATAALHLAVKVAGVKPGDAVIVPTLTFAASANCVRYEAATPIFIDSDRRTWNLDPNLLEEELAKRAARNRLPRAIMVVHLYGQTADTDSILEVCQRYDLPLIEDTAHSLGAFHRGRMVGTWGDVGAYSFSGNKVITGTTGGMFVSRRPEWIEKARSWSTQARDADPDGVHNYVHSELGYNYRMSNVVAGIVRGQLEVLSDRVQRRRSIFERYRNALEDIPGIRAQPEPFVAKAEPEIGQVPGKEGSANKVDAGALNRTSRDGATKDGVAPPQYQHTRWLSCFLIDQKSFGMSNSELIRFLDAGNVEARPVWKPMHTQPLYRGYECVGGGVAEDLHGRGICLPSSSSLAEEEQQFVIERIREAHEAQGSAAR